MSDICELWGATCGSFGGPNVLINVNEPMVTRISGPASGDTIGLGYHEVVLVAMDGAGNTDTCEFTIDLQPNFRFPFDTCLGVPPFVTPKGTFPFDNKCLLGDVELDPTVAEWNAAFCYTDATPNNTLIFPIRTYPTLPMADDLFVRLQNVVSSDGKGVQIGLFGPSGPADGCPDSGSYPPRLVCYEGIGPITMFELNAHKDSIYWIIVDGINGNTATFEIVLSGSALPVELVNFTGYNAGKTNVLTWSTATEVNSYGFYVERSVDGKNFEQIGEVKGANNSNEIIDYQFIDENPENGINYYRLMQLDLNGDFEYSNVISLNVESNFVSILSVYPNPVDDVLNYVYALPEDRMVTVDIIDLAGKKISSELQKGAEGENEDQIRTSELASGFYFLRITDEKTGASQMHKFEKN